MRLLTLVVALGVFLLSSPRLQAAALLPVGRPNPCGALGDVAPPFGEVNLLDLPGCMATILGMVPEWNILFDLDRSGGTPTPTDYTRLGFLMLFGDYPGSEKLPGIELINVSSGQRLVVGQQYPLIWINKIGVRDITWSLASAGTSFTSAPLAVNTGRANLTVPSLPPGSYTLTMRGKTVDGAVVEHSVECIVALPSSAVPTGVTLLSSSPTTVSRGPHTLVAVCSVSLSDEKGKPAEGKLFTVGFRGTYNQGFIARHLIRSPEIRDMQGNLIATLELWRPAGVDGVLPDTVETEGIPNFKAYSVPSGKEVLVHEPFLLYVYGDTSLGTSKEVVASVTIGVVEITWIPTASPNGALGLKGLDLQSRPVQNKVVIGP